MVNPLILVVEDNPDHLELAVTTLEDITQGVEIATACDGVEALDFLFGRSAQAGRNTDRQPAFAAGHRGFGVPHPPTSTAPAAG
jgi:two-component system response regulator